MHIRNNIPNAITLLNLLSGSVAIVMAFSGSLVVAGWFIILAAFFDFCDGLVARLLDAKSGIGAQLDSLADVISFGLAPSVIIYLMLADHPNLPSLTAGNVGLVPFTAFLIVIASAYRLARFNNDPGQELVFSGLPTPSTGLFIASLPLVLKRYHDSAWLPDLINQPFFLLAVTVLLSWLMVSRLRIFSMKFKSFTWAENRSRFILLGTAPLLVLLLQCLAIPVIIILHIVLSLLDSLILRKT